MELVLPIGSGKITQLSSLGDLTVDEEMFESLWCLHPVDRGTGYIFGKKVEFPRWQQSFGQSYYFTGMTHKAREIEHPYLIKLLHYVNIHSSQKYNQILINWYQDGNDYIGPHSDDESQLVYGSSIYSFSFGQERDFIVHSKEDKYRQVVPMPNNSLIIMSGDIQKHYKHSVPKRTVKKCSKRRINITCRLFKVGC